MKQKWDSPYLGGWTARGRQAEAEFYDHGRPDDADEDHQDPEADFEADRYERR